MFKKSDIWKTHRCEGDAPVGSQEGSGLTLNRKIFFSAVKLQCVCLYQLWVCQVYSAPLLKKNVLPQLWTVSIIDRGSHFVSHPSIKFKEPQAMLWREHDLLSVICTFVIPRAPIHTSHWATPVVTRQLTHRPMWAAQACQPRTAPGRRVSWAIWRAASAVCTTCWRECPRGTNRLPPPQPRAAPSLAQVLVAAPLLCCAADVSMWKTLLTTGFCWFLLAQC